MWDFGTFLLEMAHSGANSVVYFNRNVSQFTTRTTTVTVYCRRLRGVRRPPPRYGTGVDRLTSNPDQNDQRPILYTYRQCSVVLKNRTRIKLNENSILLRTVFDGGSLLCSSICTSHDQLLIMIDICI